MQASSPTREWLPHIGAPAPTERGKKKIPSLFPPSLRPTRMEPPFVWQQGSWANAPAGDVPALRPSTRVKPLAGRPGASLSHCRALHKNGNPNSGLFSRPRLAVDEREHGLLLGDHQYPASLIFNFCCFAWSAGHDPHSATPQPSRLCRWWTAPWSFSSSS